MNSWPHFEPNIYKHTHTWHRAHKFHAYSSHWYFTLKFFDRAECVIKAETNANLIYNSRSSDSFHSCETKEYKTGVHVFLRTLFVYFQSKIIICVHIKRKSGTLAYNMMSKCGRRRVSLILIVFCFSFLFDRGKHGHRSALRRYRHYYSCTSISYIQYVWLLYFD